MGRPFKLTPHQQKEAVKRRDRGGESLTEIGRSYNVSAATISVSLVFESDSEPISRKS